jgi:hypothetical protein
VLNCANVMHGLAPLTVLVLDLAAQSGGALWGRTAITRLVMPFMACETNYFAICRTETCLVVSGLKSI